jgi:uncharacterized protein (TIGR03086 family)
VQALLGHLVGTVRRAAAAAEGRPVPPLPGAAAVDARSGGASEFAAAAREARRAWTGDAPADVAAPWGVLPAPVALSGFVFELIAHTHDLWVSTGRPEPLDERLAIAALRIAERLVPASLRGPGAAFADPVPAPSSADAYARLAAFLGRAPR